MTDATRKSRWGPLGLALLCGHCALGGLLALLGLAGLATVPTIFGVSLHWIWPPIAILGAFGLWLWSGRTRDGEACALPQHGK